MASMHLVRLVSVMLVMPPFGHGAFSPAAPTAASLAPGAARRGTPPGAIAAGDLFWRQVVLLVRGLAVGLAVARFKIPAGDLMAGMVAAAVANPVSVSLPDLPAT